MQADKHLFVYQYRQVAVNTKCWFQLFGIDTANQTVSVLLKGFEPWCYLELYRKQGSGREAPKPVPERDLSSSIKAWAKTLTDSFMTRSSQDARDFYPTCISRQFRKRLYFARKLWNSELGKYQDEMFPFYQLRFASMEAMSQFTMLARRSSCKLSDNMYCNFLEADKSFEPVLKLMSSTGLPACGWVTIDSFTYCQGADKMTSLPNIQELMVKVKNIRKADPAEIGDVLVEPKIMAFDIETYSATPGEWPSAQRPDDVVYNIGVTVNQPLSNTPRQIHKYLFSLCNPKQIPGGCTLFTFAQENELLCAFTKFINTQQPHAIIGWNNFNYDWTYIIDRCKHLKCLNRFVTMGFNSGKPSPVIHKVWESSAYGEQNLLWIDTPGILQIDLMVQVKKAYKFHNYKLDTVTRLFGLEGKKALSYAKANECYTLGMNGDSAAMELVGEYCVQDTDITHKLFYKTETWLTLCEMAQTAQVPFMYTYTQGTQVQLFSQVMRHCFLNDFVVQVEKLPKSVGYEGATVIEPLPGLYDNIISFDFSSLYPSIMMSHNIDFSTLVQPELGYTYAPEHLHTHEWTVKKKDNTLYKHKFEFVKEEFCDRGIVPSLLRNLIQARKQTKKLLSELDQNEENATRITLLDCRQSSYKICANSQYGSMGVYEGKLPFMPGAMTITKIGRDSLHRAAEFLKQQGGKVIYGDTDSCHVWFESVSSKSQAEAKAAEILPLFNSTLPSPMYLDYEKLYNKYLILKKKMYIAHCLDDEGKVVSRVEKGVVAKRRDNCQFARSLFQACVQKIMAGDAKPQILEFLNDTILSMFQHTRPLDDFIITSSLKSQYKQKPAHALLADLMALRGRPVPLNERMEYVYVNYIMSEKKSKVKTVLKMEELGYFMDWRYFIHLDFLFYLQKFVNSMDQVLSVGLSENKVFAKMLNVHRAKLECCLKIKSMSQARFER